MLYDVLQNREKKMQNIKDMAEELAEAAFKGIFDYSSMEETFNCYSDAIKEEIKLRVRKGIDRILESSI